MNWIHAIVEGHSRNACAALCVRVFCVVFIYLAHTILNDGGFSGAFVSSDANALGSAPASQENGSLARGESCFDSDAILPDSKENDPFLAFHSLAATLPPPTLFEAYASLGNIKSCCIDRTPQRDALHQHLRLLAHSSQILC